MIKTFFLKEYLENKRPKMKPWLQKISVSNIYFILKINLIMNLMHWCAIILLLLATSFSFQLSEEQPNVEEFQRRRVYYSDDENICRDLIDIRDRPTKLLLEFTFEDGRDKLIK